MTYSKLKLYGYFTADAKLENQIKKKRVVILFQDQLFLITIVFVCKVLLLRL